MNFLAAAFSEQDGSPSSMRLLTLIVVLAIMAGWLSVTINTHVMAPLPIDGTGAIVLGALGIKAWQRGKETSTPTPKDTP